MLSADGLHTFHNELIGLGYALQFPEQGRGYAQLWTGDH